MKRLLIIGLLILVTALTSITLFSYLTGEETYPKNAIKTKLYSKILDEERQVIIHLPRNYNPAKKYPVMYVLDGSSQDNHIANKLNILSAVGYTPETIIVGLPNTSGKGRQRDYTPPFMRMDIDEKDSPLGEGDKFLSFMEKEVFPFIENNYPASKYRLFSGNSRGGLLVMYSLLYNPDLFQARFCYSPAFWRENNLIVSKVSDYLSSTDTLNTFLYMSLGDGENDKMKNGFDEMTKSIKEKTPNGLIWYSELTKKAGHQNNPEISASVGIGKWRGYLKNKFK